MKQSTRPTLLVIRMSALGDVAMTIPVIYSFASTHPDWNVVVLTREFFSRLFLNRPENVSSLIADVKGRHRGVKGLFRLIREARQLNITAVADLHNVLRSWVMDAAFMFMGIKVRMVKKGRSARMRITAPRKKHRIVQTNFTDRYFNVLKALGLPTEPHFTSLFAGPRTPLTEGRRSIGIAPFARYKTKTYPAEAMEEVVRTLSSQNMDIYLFGSRGKEAELLKTWEERYSGVKSIAGTLEIEQELEIMSHLDLMVTMDSANMHLASAVGTRVISIWGGTTVECGFLGWRQSSEDAISLGLPCQPCSIAGTKECPQGHLRCLKDLQPHTICTKVSRL